MGTTYTVKVVPGSTNDVDEAMLQAHIREELDGVDRRMSHYRPDSELSRFNAAGTEPVAVSEPTFTVFRHAAEASALSGGAFDVTVGPLVDAWGFGPSAPGPPPSEAAVEELRRRVGWDRIELDTERLTLRKSVPGLAADLSAIAKGYAVDRVAEALAALGFGDHMVEVGGEVRTSGRSAAGEPWRIAIESPRPGATAPLRILRLRGLALATSGGYRSYREQEGRLLTHTLDPRTGRPVTHALAAVSVLDPLCVRADALATALLVLGPEAGPALAAREGLAAFFVIDDGTGGLGERASPRFEAVAAGEAGPGRLVPGTPGG